MNKQKDGVALTSMAHPIAPWYKRLWFWLCGPKIDTEAFETVEMPQRRNSGGFNINRLPPKA